MAGACEVSGAWRFDGSGSELEAKLTGRSGSPFSGPAGKLERKTCGDLAERSKITLRNLDAADGSLHVVISARIEIATLPVRGGAARLDRESRDPGALPHLQPGQEVEVRANGALLPNGRLREDWSDSWSGAAGVARTARSPRSLQMLVLHEDASMTADSTGHEGGCTCRFVRYRLRARPLFVHCCHCRWCQRETGTAFALNALVEADRVQLLEGDVEVVDTPSNSGKGQRIARCPRCRIAVWSNYAGAGEAVRFVRVGTLDEPDRLPPDIHIYTESKQPWVVLAPGVPAVAQYYRASEHWPQDSLARREALRRRPRRG